MKKRQPATEHMTVRILTHSESATALKMLFAGRDHAPVNPQQFCMSPRFLGGFLCYRSGVEAAASQSATTDQLIRKLLADDTASLAFAGLMEGSSISYPALKLRWGWIPLLQQTLVTALLGIILLGGWKIGLLAAKTLFTPSWAPFSLTALLVLGGAVTMKCGGFIRWLIRSDRKFSARPCAIFVKGDEAKACLQQCHDTVNAFASDNGFLIAVWNLGVTDRMRTMLSLKQAFKTYFLRKALRSRDCVPSTACEDELLRHTLEIGAQTARQLQLPLRSFGPELFFDPRDI